MSFDDWRAETQIRLKKSALYNSLAKKCVADAAGAQVMALVDEATFYAFQRTKIILMNMGEFTLHDGDHLFRVLTLMERLLTEDQVQELSIPESMLLILGAFFHDIGMAASEVDAAAWRKYWDSAPVFSTEREEAQYALFKRFCSSRPEQLALVAEYLEAGKPSLADLSKNYLISDYIRTTHADRAREIIQQDWLGKIKYRDTDLTVEFASICFSHNEDPDFVLNLEKRCLCGPDTFACLPLVAVLLRLADLLDFDSKRTPSVLFSHLFVRHPVSIKEWNKHRAVEAWSITNAAIQFHAKCSHPAIQASIHAFCDAIDRELGSCTNVIASLNDFHQAAGRSLSIRIPFKVDRSKIEAKRTIDGKPEFSYQQTKFSLSKSQVIDLLMGTKLYGDPQVALRELIQNSIDACLLRAAMEKKWGNLYEPKIVIRYSSDDGQKILEVIDNGTGMDQYIVDNYYSKVGVSFYKSTDFYDLKSESKAEFTPTSRFGIGILSCFMVADTLVVDTRRVYGPHESSEPLNVMIEGQESIFWIKRGARDTPGTSTKLFLRKNRNPWEDLDDSDFIKSVETVVPNPPFKICIETDSSTKQRDETSFKEIKALSLRNYSWEKNRNIREIEVNLSNAGFVGGAVVAFLQSKGRPVARIETKRKTIAIEGDDYALGKKLELTAGHINLSSSSISIDDEGHIDNSDANSRLCSSRSVLSLHGIVVPTTLFPEPWERKNNQASLEWPIPMLLVVDVRGRMDLELNSSRTQVLMGEKWIAFEEALCMEVLAAISTQVGAAYWDKLKEVLAERAIRSEIFLRTLSQL